MFHRESPQDAAQRREDPSLPVESETWNPDDGERSRPHPRPRFGFTRWGIAVTRHSSEHQHQVPGTRRRAPGNSRALGPMGPPHGPSSVVLLSSDPVPPVLEVWFSGCHSDVGGSAVPDTVRYSLADITLRWMVKQVILSQCGIRFDDAALRRADIDISTIVPISPTQLTMDGTLEADTETNMTTSLPSPMSGRENDSGEYMIRQRRGGDGTVEEQNWPREEDVLADIHDELKIKPVWWLLEFLPIKFQWQDPDGTWKSKWGYVLVKSHLLNQPTLTGAIILFYRINVGRGRQIRDPQPNFHDSVRQRMAVSELNYKPKAQWTPGTERYVD